MQLIYKLRQSRRLLIWEGELQEMTVGTAVETSFRSDATEQIADSKSRMYSYPITAGRAMMTVTQEPALTHRRTSPRIVLRAFPVRKDPPSQSYTSCG